ncbi:uncharacterized protein FPRO_13342 [Fusarium proliferatum ET1]|uniref:Uncharacterized protein n=1 Tax=Fusarium proliferatum (strain ET1) TaxID=1227346 RepID=A0A1L7W4Y1_FUSPR|nr:uncharacterized protein FPRO_13342 [Fusarium proliferatum ET1]CVL10639.1 uncharacterized protein FPRN_12767 [Fusarium proliferatum]CZR47675.1 uncharacterized protein FPRO_13342 [Fusarium proliferatum ET1]
MSLSKPKRVHDLIAQNPRVRVWVHPLEWSEVHLELLKASFVETDTDETSENPEDGTAMVSDYRIVRQFAQTSMKNKNLKILICDNGPLKLLRPRGYFCFGEEKPLDLQGAIFNPREAVSNDSYAGAFAFIQGNLIRNLREGLFPLPNRLRHDPAAKWLRELRVKKIEPQDQWRDPYILCVLLGLAQSQAEDKTSPEYPFAEDHIFKTCAALTDDKNEDFMYFYTAEFSVAFVSKFEYPLDLKKPKDAMASELSIGMKQIFFRPYKTFRARLLAEISSAL